MKKSHTPWDKPHENIVKFIRLKTTPLPGEAPVLSTMIPSTIQDQTGQVWRRSGYVSPPQAQRYLSRGANLWIRDEGQWPPSQVNPEFVEELLNLLKDRWMNHHYWKNPVTSEYEPDAIIRLYCKQKEKKKPPKRRKGAPPEQVSLLIEMFCD